MHESNKEFNLPKMGIVQSLAIFGIASVFLIALTAFLPGKSPIVKDSVLSPHVSFIAEKMATVIPKDMKHQFVSKIKELKKAWEKSAKDSFNTSSRNSSIVTVQLP